MTSIAVGAADTAYTQSLSLGQARAARHWHRALAASMFKLVRQVPGRREGPLTFSGPDTVRGALIGANRLPDSEREIACCLGSSYSIRKIAFRQRCTELEVGAGTQDSSGSITSSGSVTVGITLPQTGHVKRPVCPNSTMRLGVA